MIIFDLVVVKRIDCSNPSFFLLLLFSEGENVDTRLEFVDKVTSIVGVSHLSFDLDDNITRMDYFDYEKDANIRRIEQKERDFTKFPSSTALCVLRTLNGHLYPKMRLEIMGSVFWSV